MATLTLGADPVTPAKADTSSGTWDWLPAFGKGVGNVASDTAKTGFQIFADKIFGKEKTAPAWPAWVVPAAIGGGALLLILVLKKKK